MRTRSMLAATALVATSLAAGLASQATASAEPASDPASAPGETVASTPVTWCDPVTPVPPCIASASRNDEDIEADPDWDVSGQAFKIGKTRYLSVNVTHDDGYELGEASLTDVIEVRLLTGNRTPRLVTGKARDTEVVRAGTGAAQEVTVAGTPVIVSGQCDGAGSCPEFGTDPELDREWVGYFDFLVSDVGEWDDPAQKESFYGMNYFTNVAHTSVPPQVVEDPATDAQMLLIELANRHYRSDGTTVVKGHGELRIPNGFLREVYGIPDPATMTGTSLKPLLSGGGTPSLSSVQEAGGQAMLVTYSNVTFSARKLRVRTGAITPTEPTQVSATRTAARRGSVDFDPSRARGAKVQGYAGRCVAVRGDHVVTASSDNIVRFTGLRKGVAYECKVRAKSKVGPSRWSKTVRMGSKVVDVR